MTRPRIEADDVFRQHADAFLDRHGEGTSQGKRSAKCVWRAP
jgi:hypothetical protein